MCFIKRYLLPNTVITGVAASDSYYSVIRVIYDQFVLVLFERKTR